MRGIAFGRITNDEKGAAKWTHEKDGWLQTGAQAHFLGSEVWAPSWSACVRNDLAPDVFLSIGNELTGPPPYYDPSGLRFSSHCVFAVASDLGDGVRLNARRAAITISQLLKSPLAVTDVRPWGRSRGESGFTDAINDLGIVGLFRHGPRHEKSPSIEILQGNWTLLRHALD
jgi:hypothetical protein